MWHKICIAIYIVLSLIFFYFCFSELYITLLLRNISILYNIINIFVYFESSKDYDSHLIRRLSVILFIVSFHIILFNHFDLVPLCLVIIFFLFWHLQYIRSGDPVTEPHLAEIRNLPVASITDHRNIDFIYFLLPLHFLITLVVSFFCALFTRIRHFFSENVSCNFFKELYCAFALPQKTSTPLKLFIIDPYKFF